MRPVEAREGGGKRDDPAANLDAAHIRQLHRERGRILTAYDIPGIEDEANGPVLRKPIDDEHPIAEVRRALADG